MDDSDFGDDIFDGVDEVELEALERPSKRQKFDASSAGYANKPDHTALAERLLKQKFGYQSFRHEQSAAIQNILAGENTLVIFPTGAGKSLCYQVWARWGFYRLASPAMSPSKTTTQTQTL